MKLLCFALNKFKNYDDTKLEETLETIIDIMDININKQSSVM